MAVKGREVRIRLTNDSRVLYRLLGGSAIYFDNRKRQGWRHATEYPDGTYVVVVARGTKYQRAVEIPAEAVERVLSR